MLNAITLQKEAIELLNNLFLAIRAVKSVNFGDLYTAISLSNKRTVDAPEVFIGTRNSTLEFHVPESLKEYTFECFIISELMNDNDEFQVRDSLMLSESILDTFVMLVRIYNLQKFITGVIDVNFVHDVTTSRFPALYFKIKIKGVPNYKCQNLDNNTIDLQKLQYLK